MNLENLETKQTLINNFFIWLFNDDRIINKNVILENEIDFTLAPYYKDANIYYPKQIADFFNTKAMKRLGRISQLDLAIDEFPNIYHNRLEHSKGVYYRKLEEMLDNFQNPTWKSQIEKNNMKLYLVAELIKMAGHDIGHMPLSHALEVQILSHRGAHEMMGKRIMLEDPEIHTVLNSISLDLQYALEDLYDKNILNFQAHDESNYDVDRFDYLMRDNLYVGKPIFMPYSHYETIPVVLNDYGLPKINPDQSIIISEESNSTIDVYDYSSLHDIEYLLELRENGYKNMYMSSNTHVRENCIKALINPFLVSKSESGKDLNNYINTLKYSDLKDIDLNLFLNWDDIKFYSQIIEIAEGHENPDIRLLATMSIPNLKAFLTMVYSHLNMYTKTKNYSADDKQFLQKLKSIITGQNSLSQNLKKADFVPNNTLVFNSNKTLPSLYKQYIKDEIIYSSTTKIKAYNPNEPIYIKDESGKIYELSHHPDRKCDWNSKISYTQNIYTYIPYLRLHGLSDIQINEMCDFCKSSSHGKKEGKSSQVNMQPLQVDHNIEDLFLEL